MATGPDGELWAFLASPAALARFDGTTWEISADDAGIPGIQAPGFHVGNMTVAPDGQLWAVGGSVSRPLLGVYDGTVWTDVFTDTGDLDTGDLDLLERPLHVAPDGTIWVRSGFLIVDPEVAATAS